MYMRPLLEAAIVVLGSVLAFSAASAPPADANLIPVSSTPPLLCTTKNFTDYLDQGLAPVADVARLLADARARGQLDPAVDPGAFARVLLALVQGFLLQLAWDPDLEAAPYRDAVLTVVDLVLRPPAP